MEHLFLFRKLPMALTDPIIHGGLHLILYLLFYKLIKPHILGPSGFYNLHQSHGKHYMNLFIFNVKSNIIFINAACYRTLKNHIQSLTILFLIKSYFVCFWSMYWVNTSILRMILCIEEFTSLGIQCMSKVKTFILSYSLIWKNSLHFYAIRLTCKMSRWYLRFAN